MEKQAHPLAFDARMEAREAAVISDEVVGASTPNTTTYTVLEGWRLYIVQLRYALRYYSCLSRY